MKFTPFPELRSKRLFLRDIKETDCDTILFLRSDKTINKFIERPEHRRTRNKADALKFIKELHENIENNKAIAWGITLKNKLQVIGTICLWNFSEDKKTAEVGYDLNPEYQGKGIMSEALSMIIDFGFKILELNKIEAFTHKDNEKSKNLLWKNGFELMEHRKDEENEATVIFEIKMAAPNRDV